MTHDENQDRVDSKSKRLPRIVKAVAWMIAGGLVVVAAALLTGVYPEPGAGGSTAAVAAHDDVQLWTCSMHPQVIQEHPGQCPICKMDLVPLRDSGGNATSEAVGTTHEHQSAEQLWTCSMHPQVIQDHPGQCPICGMNLVPLRDTGSAAKAREDAAGMANDGPVVTIDPAVVQNMNVTTVTVTRRDVSRQIRTLGYLDYDQERMVSITTKYPGFIEKVYVNYVGEPVRKGQPLFEIYAPELVQTEQELLSAARYAGRMAATDEQTRLRAESLLEAARERLRYWDITEQQIADIERTGKVVRTLRVVAPASGVIMKRMNGLEGMATRPGMELLHIADMSNLWLTVEVYEGQLPWVNVGSVATVSLTYFPGETFRARIRFVEPEVSETTRAVKLTLDVPNDGGRLKVGMYATVIFEPVAAKNALTVPSSAILRTGERNIAIVAIGDGRFAPRELRLGAEGDGFTQVLDGLHDGDRVVTSSQFLIDSESNLREAIQKMIAARKKRASTAADEGTGSAMSGHQH